MVTLAEIRLLTATDGLAVNDFLSQLSNAVVL